MKRPREMLQSGGLGPARKRRFARKRRLGVGLVAFLAVAAGVLAAVVLVLPQYVARHVIATELRALGVRSEGIGSLKIDVWGNEVTLGAVEFWAADADRGQIGSLALEYDLAALLERRALFRRAIIEGIDLVVERGGDGALTVNGIALAGLMPGTDVQRSAAAGWTAGVDDVLLRAGRLVLRTAAGGELTIEIDQLAVANAYGWDSDQPQRVVFAGRFNDIAARIEADARMLAETLSADARFRLEAVDIPKISKLAGPLGFERRAGSIDVDGRATISVSANGTIAIEAAGTGTSAGADIARPEMELAFDRADFRFDSMLVATAAPPARGDSGPAARWEASGDFQVRLGAGTVSLPESAGVAFRNAAVDVRGLAVIGEADGGTTLSGAPTVGVEGLDVLGPVPVTAARLELTLGRLALKSAGGSLSLRLQGTGTAARARMLLPGAEVRANEVRLTLRDSTAISARGEMRFAADVDAHASGLNGSLPAAGTGATIAADRLDLALRHLRARTGAQSISAEGAGTARISGLSASVPADGGRPDLKLSAARLRAALSRASAAATEEGIRWRTPASVEVEEIAVDTDADATAALRIGTLLLGGATIDQDLSIAAAELSLRNAEFAFSDQTLVLLAGIDGAAGARAVVRPAIRIERIGIEDQAKIWFTDTSVDPLVAVEAVVTGAELRNLDAAKPDEPAEVRLDADVNEFAKLRVSGWVRPLTRPPDFELEASVVALQLPPFSPYAAEMLGVELDSGALTARAQAAAVEGALAGFVDMELDNLQFARQTAETEDRFTSGVGVPVERLAALLQDSGGRIALSLPVAGTLDRPDVDLSDAITQAVGGALTTLFPPAAIARMLTAPATFDIDLEPIVFKPGAAELDEDGLRFADALARLLAERPKLSVTVCGVATAADFEAYTAGALRRRAPGDPTAVGPSGARIAAVVQAARPALDELAVARTRALRRHLITGRGIAARRVAECRARYDPRDSGPPRVEVSV